MKMCLDRSTKKTDFIDPEDTNTFRDLDDDFTAADMENLISEISTWGFESWNAVIQQCLGIIPYPLVLKIAVTIPGTKKPMIIQPKKQWFNLLPR